jgi:hypothetical protein
MIDNLLGAGEERKMSAMRTESGTPVDQALAFIPMSELSIEETWSSPA